MIEIAKAHSVAAAIELPAFELPDVQNIYMTSLPVAQALQPEVFSFWDRDAVEGQDYTVIGYDKVQSLVGSPGWKYFNFWFNQKFCVRPGQAKFFRIYQSGNDVQIMLHRATDRSHIISLNESSVANTWQTMAFNYRADGYFEWYWQSIRKWNGWPGGQPVMPFIRASSPNIIQVDTGQSGLTPPAGYTWLEPE